MFRYINMPKLVAFYLREFSVNNEGHTSLIYHFVFCLCLPFVSRTFRRARMNALAIAECTNSEDQITRVLKEITGADMLVVPNHDGCMLSYDGTYIEPVFPYDDSDGQDDAIVIYDLVPNAEVIITDLNGATQAEVQAYLELLLPFYVGTTIIWQDNGNQEN